MRWMRVQLLALLLFTAGLCILLYPSFSQWYHRAGMQRAMTAYGAMVTRLSLRQDTAESAALPVPAAGETPLERLRAALASYNAALYLDGQRTLCDPFAYEQPGIDLSCYGIEENVIGVLRIERMEAELPVYLGATEENLKRGVALLGQTSIPIGGDNTNAVIAGHRGYSGAAMFRSIERLAQGDAVFLDGLFGTLEYRVFEVRIIDPDDIDAILIQEGRELLTLMTCHPYRENRQRYVVYCERAE